MLQKMLQKCCKTFVKLKTCECAQWGGGRRRMKRVADGGEKYLKDKAHAKERESNEKALLLTSALHLPHLTSNPFKKKKKKN